MGPIKRMFLFEAEHAIMFILNGPFPASFLYILLFNIVDSKCSA